MPSDFGYYETAAPDKANQTMTAGFGARTTAFHTRNNTSYKKKRMTANKSVPEFVSANGSTEKAR